MVEEQAEPQALQRPAVQIMQPVTITPMPEFCPDAKSEQAFRQLEQLAVRL